MTADKIDIFALVALDIRLCYFVHVSEVQARTKRIAARLFSPAAEKETWLEAISRVRRASD
jgi:heme/copper-type cytochrome/quinol oxidase subunit 4